jgi:hypothetical protein
MAYATIGAAAKARNDARKEKAIALDKLMFSEDD